MEKNGTRQERRGGGGGGEAPAAKLYFNEEAYHLEALIAVGIGPLLPLVPRYQFRWWIIGNYQLLAGRIVGNVAQSLSTDD